jgi:hypothetical protein
MPDDLSNRSVLSDRIRSLQACRERWQFYQMSSGEDRRQRRGQRRKERANRRTMRDEQRGYKIDYKRLALAYGAEAVIASASAYGQYLFAQQSSTDWLTVHQMMLAPIAYATVEFLRVPLALSVRAHRQWPIRLVALVGVTGAAGITVKSMSQLGNLMFAPRLTEVVTARENLDLAQAVDDQVIQQIAVADGRVAQRSTDLNLAVDREKAASSGLTGLPKPICHKISWYDKRVDTVVTSTACNPDSRSTLLANGLTIAQSGTRNAQAAYDLALHERTELDRTAADRALASARNAFREALRKSQLHDFSSMVWGISPTKVTDGMIAQFLRVFVFGAAIFVAFASTMIAFTAVTRVKPGKKTITVGDRHEEFAFQPFAERMMAESNSIAEAAAKVTAEKIIADAKAAEDEEREAKLARAKALEEGKSGH